MPANPRSALALSCARAAVVMVIATVLPVATPHAGVPTADECRQAAEFIANAARARDNGMSRDAYLARIEGDLIAIRAFPPELRWFVKDDDDERFLLAATARVYDRPRSAAQHHAEFLAACVERGS